MGHAIQFYNYPETKKPEYIYAELSEMVEHECWQEGGSLEPIRFIGNVITNDYDEAVKYIEAHDKGWYDCLAVKYKSYKKIESNKLKNLQDKMGEAYDNWKKEDEKIYMESIKSMYPSCRHCNSKMLRKHLLRTNYCPVCGNDLRTDTILSKIERLKQKYYKISDDYNKEEKALKEKSKNYELRWLVKIEYHV